MVCERWCVTKMVCDREEEAEEAEEEAGGGRGGRHRSKNKNPTQ